MLLASVIPCPVLDKLPGVFPGAAFVLGPGDLVIIGVVTGW